MLKKLTCWYCHLNGYDVLNKLGCCKRCGTNLKKYPTRKSLPYPCSKNRAADEQIDREVLGTREKFCIPDENDQDDW